MKVLYSPIGNSDPINYFYDGPMLACARHVKPDKIVLFLTKDMCSKENEHGLYTSTISLLSKKINNEILCVLKKHDEISDPQLSSNVFEIMLNDLAEIGSAHAQDEVYLNISSGTPAIKSTLEILAFLLPYNFTLLHVDMPTETISKNLETGRRDIVSNNDETEYLWESDLDNEDGATDRVHEVIPDKSTPIGRCFIHTQLNKLIEKSEYRAALDILDDAPENDALKTALTGALMRSQYNYVDGFRKLEAAGWSEASELKKHTGAELFKAAEAVLAMQNAVERSDLRDMLLRLTPVVLVLATVALEKVGIKVKTFTSLNEGKTRIVKSKLMKAIPNLSDTVKNNIFRNNDNPYLDDWHLINILKDTGKAPQVVDKLNKLRNIESDARNEMAHQLTYMDEVKLYENIKTTPEKLIESLHNIFALLDKKYIGPEYWASYKRMNDFLKSLVQI